MHSGRQNAANVNGRGGLASSWGGCRGGGGVAVVRAQLQEPAEAFGGGEGEGPPVVVISMGSKRAQISAPSVDSRTR